ncbi:unnamed protein product [Amoebophrya sp. A25]|nr:unnamed protein product [Amoebophrya sp. A25]|eukprot:GSA25T00027098001.1
MMSSASHGSMRCFVLFRLQCSSLFFFSLVLVPLVEATWDYSGSDPKYAPDFPDFDCSSDKADESWDSFFQDLQTMGLVLRDVAPLYQEPRIGAERVLAEGGDQVVGGQGDGASIGRDGRRGDGGRGQGEGGTEDPGSDYGQKKKDDNNDKNSDVNIVGGTRDDGAKPPARKPVASKPIVTSRVMEGLRGLLHAYSDIFQTTVLNGGATDLDLPRGCRLGLLTYQLFRLFWLVFDQRSMLFKGEGGRSADSASASGRKQIDMLSDHVSVIVDDDSGDMDGAESSTSVGLEQQEKHQQVLDAIFRVTAAELGTPSTSSGLNRRRWADQAYFLYYAERIDGRGKAQEEQYARIVAKMPQNRVYVREESDGEVAEAIRINHAEVDHAEQSDENSYQKSEEDASPDRRQHVISEQDSADVLRSNLYYLLDFEALAALGLTRGEVVFLLLRSLKELLTGVKIEILLGSRWPVLDLLGVLERTDVDHPALAARLFHGVSPDLRASRVWYQCPVTYVLEWPTLRSELASTAAANYATVLTRGEGGGLGQWAFAKELEQDAFPVLEGSTKRFLVAAMIRDRRFLQGSSTLERDLLETAGRSCGRKGDQDKERDQQETNDNQSDQKTHRDQDHMKCHVSASGNKSSETETEATRSTILTPEASEDYRSNGNDLPVILFFLSDALCGEPVDFTTTFHEAESRFVEETRLAAHALGNTHPQGSMNKRQVSTTNADWSEGEIDAAVVTRFCTALAQRQESTRSSASEDLIVKADVKREVLQEADSKRADLLRDALSGTSLNAAQVVHFLTNDRFGRGWEMSHHVCQAGTLMLDAFKYQVCARQASQCLEHYAKHLEIAIQESTHFFDILGSPFPVFTFLDRLRNSLIRHDFAPVDFTWRELKGEVGITDDVAVQLGLISSEQDDNSSSTSTASGSSIQSFSSASEPLRVMLESLPNLRGDHNYYTFGAPGDGSKEGINAGYLVYASMVFGTMFNKHIPAFVAMARRVMLPVLVLLCLDDGARKACDAERARSEDGLAIQQQVQQKNKDEVDPSTSTTVQEQEQNEDSISSTTPVQDSAFTTLRLICIPGHKQSILHKFTLPLMLLHLGLDVFWLDFDVFVLRDPLPPLKARLVEVKKPVELLVSASFADDCICTGIVFFRSTVTVRNWLLLLLAYLFEHVHLHDQQFFSMFLSPQPDIDQLVGFESASADKLLHRYLLPSLEVPTWAILDPVEQFVSAWELESTGWTGKMENVVMFHFLQGDSEINEQHGERSFVQEQRERDQRRPLLQQFFGDAYHFNKEAFDEAKLYELVMRSRREQRPSELLHCGSLPKESLKGSKNGVQLV